MKLIKSINRNRKIKRQLEDRDTVLLTTKNIESK